MIHFVIKLYTWLQTFVFEELTESSVVKCVAILILFLICPLLYFFFLCFWHTFFFLNLYFFSVWSASLIENMWEIRLKPSWFEVTCLTLKRKVKVCCQVSFQPEWFRKFRLTYFAYFSQTSLFKSLREVIFIVFFPTIRHKVKQIILFAINT